MLTNQYALSILFMLCHMLNSKNGTFTQEYVCEVQPDVLIRQPNQANRVLLLSSLTLLFSPPLWDVKL
jgi:hypothetical protein